MKKEISLTACWSYKVEQSLDVWIIHEATGGTPDMIFYLALPGFKPPSQLYSTCPVGDFWARFFLSSARRVQKSSFCDIR